MTRRLQSTCAALVLTACALTAQTQEQLFSQANGLYQQGKYADAKGVYESIASSGVASGELYYNLGNACYKTGDLARAILNYERAAKVMPADDDLLHNLRLANLAITDRIEATPRLFLWEYWDGIRNWFSLRGAMAGTGAAFAFMIGALIVVVLARTYALRKYAAILTTALGVVWLFSLTVFLAKSLDLARDDEAILITPIATVKNSPDAKSSDAFVLHGGVKMQVTDRFSDWMKIRLADGKVGWLESTTAEII
jgi:tetratricopeptide (TPR) repeat protein